MPKKHPVLIQIGNKIRLNRERLGYTQESFAAKIGADRKYISLIERGEQNITMLTLYKIIKSLDMTYKEFFES